MIAAPIDQRTRRLRGRLDVGDAVAMERFAERVWERLGPSDLWINNAGVLEPIAPEEDDDR